MPSQKPTITNPAKEKLKAHRPITRMNVFESLRPSVVKIAAMAGFDLILVDTEHVIHNDETLTNFLVLARDNGVAPVVTVIAPDRATSRLRWGYTASGSTQRSWPPWRVWCNEPWRAASPSSPLPCLTDRAAYERELERGVRIFGAMRRSEHDLLREAANNVMAV